MFQKLTNNIVSILILIVIGFILGVYYTKPSESSQTGIDTEYIDSVLVKNEIRKIDSLKNRINEIELINNNLRDSIKLITITRVIEVDAVRKLPLDSGVIFLKQKLREFEDNR